MRPQITRHKSSALDYTVVRRSRVTKRLHMELDEQGGLVVVAPRHWSGSYISMTLTKNLRRVERFLENARERQLKPLQYTHGEQHLYLGKCYPLVIHENAAGRNHIAVTGDEICVKTTTMQSEKIQAGLQNWYQCMARTVFKERLLVVAHRAPWVKAGEVPLKLRRMKRTWGNCSSRGVIKLNTHLVKAPLDVIDSVVAHELCHLEEMNHGRAFYALLEQLNPNWQQDRDRLRRDGITYLLN